MREESLVEEQRAIAQRFFEPKLQEAGLTVAQLQSLDLAGLREALERTNEAIAHSEQFGLLKLKITADSGLVVTRASTEAHFEVGILPLLFERKQLILARVRELASAERVSNLRELVRGVPDARIRAELESELTELEAESERLRAEKAEVQVAQEEATAVVLSELERKRFELEVLERRSAVWRSFLERESVATVLGALLLIILIVAQITAMFTGTAVPQLVANAFLIIR